MEDGLKSRLPDCKSGSLGYQRFVGQQHIDVFNADTEFDAIDKNELGDQSACLEDIIRNVVAPMHCDQ